jgi:hypothetical protein
MDEKPWLSKDLLVRLRWWAFKFCGKGEQENLASDAMSEAVSRIKKLEAALREIADGSRDADKSYVSLFHEIQSEARKALEGKDGA